MLKDSHPDDLSVSVPLTSAFSSSSWMTCRRRDKMAVSVWRTVTWPCKDNRAASCSQKSENFVSWDKTWPSRALLSDSSLATRARRSSSCWSRDNSVWLAVLEPWRREAISNCRSFCLESRVSRSCEGWEGFVYMETWELYNKMETIRWDLYTEIWEWYHKMEIIRWDLCKKT